MFFKVENNRIDFAPPIPFKLPKYVNLIYDEPIDYKFQRACAAEFIAMLFFVVLWYLIFKEVLLISISLFLIYSLKLFALKRPTLITLSLQLRMCHGYLGSPES